MGEGGLWRKEGERSSQGICIKDLWTKTMEGGRTECSTRGVGRAGGNNGGKMGTTVIEQKVN